MYLYKYTHIYTYVYIDITLNPFQRTVRFRFIGGTCRGTLFVRQECREGPTKGPSRGYQRLVLGAIGSFLSTFGDNCPRFLKNLSKLTFE